MQGETEPAITHDKRETLGAYLVNVLFSMLFPFMALWYCPKYLLKGESVKGLVIILIVVAELVLAYSMFYR